MKQAALRFAFTNTVWSQFSKSAAIYPLQIQDAGNLSCAFATFGKDVWLRRNWRSPTATGAVVNGQPESAFLRRIGLTSAGMKYGVLQPQPKSRMRWLSITKQSLRIYGIVSDGLQRRVR